MSGLRRCVLGLVRVIVEADLIIDTLLGNSLLSMWIGGDGRVIRHNVWDRTMMKDAL